jgi:hypothetical protein
MQIPAGWYPDPARPEARRYWDGAGWTAGVASTSANPTYGWPARAQVWRTGERLFAMTLAIWFLSGTLITFARHWIPWPAVATAMSLVNLVLVVTGLPVATIGAIMWAVEARRRKGLPQPLWPHVW